MPLAPLFGTLAIFVAGPLPDALGIQFEKSQASWLEAVFCDSFIRMFNGACDKVEDMKSKFLLVIDKVIVALDPLLVTKQADVGLPLVPGIQIVLRTLRGLLCCFSAVPHIHGCTYDDFKYVNADLARGKIMKDLPRGTGRIIASGLKTKCAEELVAYEQFSGPEQTAGPTIWHAECKMNSLALAKCWSEKGGRCGSEIQQGKDLIDEVHENRDLWIGSLRPGVCVGLDAAALALVKVVVEKTLADEDLDIASTTFMSFERAVKQVKSNEARDVHKIVLEKLAMFEGANLHKSLALVVERIHCHCGPSSSG